jgi:hypothetical protein
MTRMTSQFIVASVRGGIARTTGTPTTSHPASETTPKAAVRKTTVCRSRNPLARYHAAHRTKSIHSSDKPECRSHNPQAVREMHIRCELPALQSSMRSSCRAPFRPPALNHVPRNGLPFRKLRSAAAFEEPPGNDANAHFSPLDSGAASYITASNSAASRWSGRSSGIPASLSVISSIFSVFSNSICVRVCFPDRS